MGLFTAIGTGYAIGGSFPFGMGAGYIICSGLISNWKKSCTQNNVENK